MKSMHFILYKKILTTLLVGVLFLGLFMGRTAHATLPVTDPGVTTGQTVKAIFDKLGEVVLAPLMGQIMNQLLNKVNNSMINWVNSGFDGNPFYVDDPKQFFGNMALESASFVAGGIRTQLNDLEKCDDPNVNSGLSASQCDTFQSKTANRSVLYALGTKAFSGTTDALATNPDTLKAFGQSLGQSVNPLDSFTALVPALQGMQTELASLTATSNQLTQLVQNITSGNVPSSGYNVALSSQTDITGALSSIENALGSAQTALQQASSFGIQSVATLENDVNSFRQGIQSDISAIQNYQISNPPTSASIQGMLSQVESFTQEGNSLITRLGSLGGGVENNKGVLERFQEGDFKIGGHEGYEALLLDPNATPLGRYQNTLSSIAKTQQQDTQALENSGKQLGETECANEIEVEDAEGNVISSYCAEFDVLTPPTVIGGLASNALNSRTEAVISAGNSTSPYAQIAASVASAAIQSLTTNLFNSAFSKLTDAAQSAIGLGIDQDTPSGDFEEITDVEDPFLTLAEQESALSINAELFDIDDYIQGPPLPLEVQGSPVIWRFDGSLARSQDPFAEIATAEESTGSVTYDGTSLAVNSVDTPALYSLITVTDPDDAIPGDTVTYLVDEDRYVYVTTYSSTDQAFGLVYTQGAQAMYAEATILLNSQIREIGKIPETLMAIDQHCVLGPDRGFVGRLRDHSMNESQKATRKAQKNNNRSDDWERALDGMSEARNLAYSLPDNSTFNDPFSARYKIHVDSTERWKSDLNEATINLSEFGTRRQQLKELITYYNDPSLIPPGSGITIQNVKRSILDIAQRDPISPRYLENLKSSAERARAANSLYQTSLQECKQLKEVVFDSSVTPDDIGLEAPRDLELLRKRILQDNVTALYCPWKDIRQGYLRFNPVLSLISSQEIEQAIITFDLAFDGDRASYTSQEEYEGQVEYLIEYAAENFGIGMEPPINLPTGANSFIPDIVAERLYLDEYWTALADSSASDYEDQLESAYETAQTIRDNAQTIGAPVFGDYALQFFKDNFIVSLEAELAGSNPILTTFDADNSPSTREVTITNDTKNKGIRTLFSRVPVVGGAFPSSDDAGKSIEISCDRYYRSDISDYTQIDQS